MKHFTEWRRVWLNGRWSPHTPGWWSGSVLNCCLKEKAAKTQRPQGTSQIAPLGGGGGLNCKSSDTCAALFKLCWWVGFPWGSLLSFSAAPPRHSCAQFTAGYPGPLWGRGGEGPSPGGHCQGQWSQHTLVFRKGSEWSKGAGPRAPWAVF